MENQITSKDIIFYVLFFLLGYNFARPIRKKVNLLKSWTLPIETVSEGNLFEHWHKSARRHTKQKQLVKIYLKELYSFKDRKITVKLIRISPRTLDADENLRMAFKWIKDQISEIIYPEKTIVDPKCIQRAIQKNIELAKEGKKLKRVVRRVSGRADDTDLITWEYDQEKGKPKGIRVEIYER